MSHASKEPDFEAQPVDGDTEERQYLTGLGLAIVLGSLTLVSFLVLLDMSILGTVSHPSPRRSRSKLLTQTGHPSNYHRVQRSTRRWLVHWGLQFVRVRYCSFDGDLDVGN